MACPARAFRPGSGRWWTGRRSASIAVVWLQVAVAPGAAAQVPPGLPPLSASCTAPAVAELEAGATALAMLDRDAARTAFARARRLDPACAPAAFGLAITWLDLPAIDLEDPGDLARARSALPAMPADEQESEDAAHVRQLGRPIAMAGLPSPFRIHELASSARGIATRRPDDLLVHVVAVLSALAVSSTPDDQWQREAGRLAARMARSRADAPASVAARVLVCARARPSTAAGDAGECLEAARRAIGAGQASPRVLRAAARTLAGRGAWAEAAAADEAALARAGGVEAAVWLAGGRWREHPLPWLVRSEVARGRFAAARARLTAARARYEEVARGLAPAAAWRLRGAIDLAWIELQWGSLDWQGPREWPDAALEALPPTADRPARATASADTALWRELRLARALVEGALAARAAWPRGEPDRLARARRAASTLEGLSAESPSPPRAEWARTVVLASMAAATEAREELALLRAQLDALQQQLDVADGDALPAPSLALLAGEWHLQLRDASEASERFRGAAGSPDAARAWLGHARAAREAGRADEAREAYARFLDAWREADEPRRETAEARSFLR